jgi:hypothetical protein
MPAEQPEGAQGVGNLVCGAPPPQLKCPAEPCEIAHEGGDHQGSTVTRSIERV